MSDEAECYGKLPPEERYQRDPQFKFLVDYLENMINQARFTPLELKRSCVLGRV